MTPIDAWVLIAADLDEVAAADDDAEVLLADPDMLLEPDREEAPEVDEALALPLVELPVMPAA